MYGLRSQGGVPHDSHRERQNEGEDSRDENGDGHDEGADAVPPPDYGHDPSSAESKVRFQQLQDQIKDLQDMFSQVQLQAGTQVNPTPRVLPPPTPHMFSTKLPPTGDIKKFTSALPGMTGGLSIEVYLRKIEAETPSAIWSDFQRILLARTNVAGAAKTRCSYRNLNEFDDWERYKTEMIECFTISKTDRAQCLNEYAPKRKKGETIQEFIDRVSDDLDSLSTNGRMPEEDKVAKIQCLLFQALPRQLHCDMGTPDSIPELSNKLVRRAERFPDLKLTKEDIAKETSETAPWTPVSTSNPPPPTPATVEKEKPTVAAAGTSTTSTTPTSSTSTAQDKKPQKKGKNPPSRGKPSSVQSERNCAGCGRTGHYRSECRALGATCYFCGTQGHLSSVCRQRKKNANQPSGQGQMNRNTSKQRWQGPRPQGYSQPPWQQQQAMPPQQQFYPAMPNPASVAAIQQQQQATQYPNGAYRPPWAQQLPASNPVPATPPSSVPQLPPPAGHQPATPWNP